MLSSSKQSLCSSLHIQKADVFFCLQRETQLSNETPAGEEKGCCEKGQQGLNCPGSTSGSVTVQPGLCVSLWNRLAAGPAPEDAHLRAVLLWKGLEVQRRGELTKELSSPLISSGLQPRCYFLRKITWLCWSSRWHCDIKANEERQASKQGTDKRTGRWIFIIVMFRCETEGCRNFQRLNIFCGILWEPYVWQFTNQEGNGA